jgi:hypothetical protein
MTRQFEESGVRFRYPDNWRLEREDSDHGWTVSLYGPDTAFVMVACDETMPAPEEMAAAALDALKTDYPNLEAEETIDSLAGQMAVGHDVRFFSLDMTNTCWTRSLYTAAGTVLVLCQTNDLELEQSEPVLRAICASMEVEQD